MKTLMKTTIGIMAMAISSVSVAHDHPNRYERGFEKHRHEQSQHSRDVKRHYQWKRERDYKSHRNNDRRITFVERRNWKHKHRHDKKCFYRKHGARYLKKHVYNQHSYAPPRRIEKRVYQYEYYTPPPRRVVERVVIRERAPRHTDLSAVAGGLIGSAIAHDMSDGDPGATFGGAVVGAMIGNAVSHH